MIRTQVIRKVIAKINSVYGKNREDLPLTTFAESIFAKPKLFIKSGIFPLDCIVGKGRGIPAGIIEVFGPEGSGKSAIMESILAKAQKLGYYTGIFPQEYTMEEDRVKSVGLNVEELMVSDAETIEEIYDQIKSTTLEIRKYDKKTPIVYGWDSVAATPTRSELDHKKGLAASDMGKFANQMSKLFRRLVRFLRKNDVCLICVNQTRASMEMYGPKETTYGGKALRFYAWVRMRTKVAAPILDAQKRKIGHLMEVETKKNKAGAPPFMTCLLPLYYFNGIHATEAVWHYALELGVIHRKGTAYRIGTDIVTRRSFPKIYKRKGKLIRKLIRRVVCEQATSAEGGVVKIYDSNK